MGVAAGVSDHRGWIVVVCMGERDGVPFVADRRRIDLVDEGVESQPFHHADPGATAGTGRTARRADPQGCGRGDRRARTKRKLVLPNP